MSFPKFCFVSETVSETVVFKGRSYSKPRNRSNTSYLTRLFAMESFVGSSIELFTLFTLKRIFRIFFVDEIFG